MDIFTMNSHFFKMTQQWVLTIPRSAIITSKSIGITSSLVSSWFYAQKRNEWGSYPIPKAAAAVAGTGCAFTLGTLIVLRYPIITLGSCAVAIACLVPKGPLISVTEYHYNNGRPKTR